MVSVIVPCYNCENYIEEAINSILNQTFSDFEILVVDDLSTDNTAHILEKLRKRDKRIKYFKLSKKGGATGARNKALREAKGKYIAFLDGDDLWEPQKLEKQIKFMEDNNIYFSYTDYEYIDEKSKRLNRMRKCPFKMSYLRMLFGDSVGCLTVIYNAEKTGLIQIPNIGKRNDYALWCVVLKKVKRGFKYPEILALYRKSSGSLSSGGKIGLLKYHYYMHRNINCFNPVIALFLTFINGINYLVNKVVYDTDLSSKKEKYYSNKIVKMGDKVR